MWKRSIDSLGLISVSSINTLLRCWNLEITSAYLGFSQQSYHVDFPQGGGQAEKSFNVRDLDLVHHLTCENHHHLDSLILLIIWLSLQLSSEGSEWFLFFLLTVNTRSMFSILLLSLKQWVSSFVTPPRVAIPDSHHFLKASTAGTTPTPARYHTASPDQLLCLVVYLGLARHTL